VFKIKALILEPHKQNLCETNSIQKTTKFIINIMSQNHEKLSTISIQQLRNNNKVDNNEEHETRTNIENEDITTSSTVFN